MPDNHSYLMATPEKALVDLLYLHPFYKTAEDMEQIRLDDWFMSDDLNRERLDGYLKQIDSPSLTQRMNTLLKIYQ